MAQVGVFAYLCAGRHKRISKGDLPSLRDPGSRKTGNRGYPLTEEVSSNSKLASKETS